MKKGTPFACLSDLRQSDYLEFQLQFAIFLRDLGASAVGQFSEKDLIGERLLDPVMDQAASRQ